MQFGTLREMQTITSTEDSQQARKTQQLSGLLKSGK